MGFVGFVVFTSQSCNFGAKHLNVLVSFTTIFSFAQSSDLRQLYLSLLIFFAIHHVKQAFGKLEGFDASIIGRVQKTGPRGRIFLKSETTYLMWQPLVYGCLTAGVSVCAMTAAIITEILRDNSYAVLIYGVLSMGTAWINLWYFFLYFLLYFQHGRWFKLHILAKIQQSAVSEYWNFHFVDVGNLDSKLSRYRALVLTNESYEDTVEYIRADVHAKRKHIDKIRTEDELESAIKSRDTGMAEGEGEQLNIMLHTKSYWGTGFVVLYLGILANMLVLFFMCNVLRCDLADEEIDIFGNACADSTF
mmetsp:Transcript_670/g.1138  ORF Transcript_670/g.1138 Transcript_670/m.1138 type:complete len:305 (-) Transcript_670:67-981(-)